MSGNAVTDKHVGTVGPGKWNPQERYRDARSKAGLNEDAPIPHRAKRSGKNLPKDPTWQDFEPGMQVICRMRQFLSGYLVHLHCEVIDSHGEVPKGNHRAMPSQIFAVVIATTSERYDDLVGHIVQIRFDGWARMGAVEPTRKTVGEFKRMPKDLKKGPCLSG